MATGLDIAAGSLGIVSIAQQLAESVLKIRTFCKDVKNAPAELQETVDAIESMSRILTQLGQTNTEEADADSIRDIFRASLDLCKRAVERIVTLAAGLQKEMERRRFWAAVKTTLKKREIREMLEKLSHSKIELHIAYSMYADACRKRDIDKITKYMEEERSHRVELVEYTQKVSRAQDGANTEEHTCPTQRKRPKSPNGENETLGSVTTVHIQLPLWLCKYAWDVSFAKSSGLWTMSFKTYQVLPEYGIVYRLCIIGDIKTIAKLLHQRQLCLHDQFEDGNSLFSVAVRYQRTELAGVLISSGAEATWSPGRKIGSTISESGLHLFSTGSDPFERPRAIAQLLLDNWEGDHPGAIALLEAFAKSPLNWTSLDRLIICSSAGWCEQDDLIVTILGGEAVSPELFHAKIPIQKTRFLHVIADRLQKLLGAPWFLNLNKTAEARSLSLWSSLLEQGVRAGANLHATTSNGLTPFVMFLKCLLRDVRSFGNGVAHRFDILNGTVQYWAQTLARASVDLEEYGRIEYTFINVRRGGRWRKYFSVLGFIQIKYGPRPSDWGLWFQQPGDVFAGIFWNMLEHMPLAIPGSWIKDDDEYLSYYEDRRMPLISRKFGVVWPRLRQRMRTIKTIKYGQLSSMQELENILDPHALIGHTRRVSETQALVRSFGLIPEDDDRTPITGTTKFG